MPDIIIHGASGFLGKHFLKRLLSENIPVVILAREASLIPVVESNPLVTVYRYKESPEILAGQNIQVQSPVFFEFSWQGVFGSERNKEDQSTVNIPLIRSSIQLASRFNSKHWIGIGSQAEYGNLDKCISENDVCRPTSEYGKAKLACAELSGELCDKLGMDHSWLRLFSVYGPDDNHDWLIQYLIKEMLNNKDVNVTKGEQFWDYLYIDDVTEMFYKLKDATGVGIANLGSGKGVQVKYIIEKIKELTNSNSKINFGAVPYRDDQVMLMEADITKLSKHLDWYPKTNIDEGLQRTVEFLKAKLKV
jgi:UDP-glucose 4-epimerase